jgi:hypothetical protein
VIEIVSENDRTDAVFAAIHAGVRDTISELLDLGEEKAKEYAPVRKGDLQAGIHADKSQLDEQRGMVESATNLEYPIHQEFGTVRMAAQPHMLPAGNDMSAAAVPALTKHINTRIGEVA